MVKMKLWTKRHWIALAFLVAISCCTAGIWTVVWMRAQTISPINIPIQNPSFEATVSFPQDACGQNDHVPPGWTAGDISNGYGGFVIVKRPPPIPCDFSPPPDGNQMAVILDSSLSQDLGDVYTILPHDVNGEVNGVYTLHVLVANYFYWYPGHFSISLSLKCLPTSQFCIQGSTETLCSVSGIGSGDFVDIPLVCPSQRQYGELFLSLASIGYQNLVDKVSLTFTPQS